MVNEGEYLEITEHFKTLMEKKNEEILQLKKNLIFIYGMVRATDENFGDIVLLDLIRDYLSGWIEDFLEK
jgi:hypothetical protein